MEKAVPEHTEGAQSNTESSVSLENEEQAKKHFEEVKQRLSSVNKWDFYAGSMSADFHLTDENGKEINRTPKEGDYFRINIPGPGSDSGEGYDWVRVEKIHEEHEDNEDCFSIRVRPAPSPVNDKKDVAHFFSNEATSSFVVMRNKNKVTAAVYGRNEKPNTDAETVTDKVRNAAVATGAMTLFSKLQWKSLVNGLVKE